MLLYAQTFVGGHSEESLFSLSANLKAEHVYNNFELSSPFLF